MTNHIYICITLFLDYVGIFNYFNIIFYIINLNYIFLFRNINLTYIIFTFFDFNLDKYQNS